MTTIEKTVKIPEDRRLRLDMELPDDVPIGEVNVSVTITPLPEKHGKRTLASFCGILKDDPLFIGDAVEFQRKMRDEW
jgi:hypothetical protein